MFPGEAPGGAGPWDGGSLCFGAPRLSRCGLGVAVDAADKDGSSELSQGPRPWVMGSQVVPLQGTHAVGTAKRVSDCRERSQGCHDGQEQSGARNGCTGALGRWSLRA